MQQLYIFCSKDSLTQQKIRQQNLGYSVPHPSIPNLGLNIFSEAVGTFITCICNQRNGKCARTYRRTWQIYRIRNHRFYRYVTGGLTGYAINPARDLGPRLAHAVLPIKGKGSSNWGYGVVTLVGPVIGAVAAVLLYGAIPW